MCFSHKLCLHILCALHIESTRNLVQHKRRCVSYTSVRQAVGLEVGKKQSAEHRHLKTILYCDRFMFYWVLFRFTRWLVRWQEKKGQSTIDGSAFEKKKSSYGLKTRECLSSLTMISPILDSQTLLSSIKESFLHQFKTNFHNIRCKWELIFLKIGVYCVILYWLIKIKWFCDGVSAF